MNDTTKNKWLQLVLYVIGTVIVMIILFPLFDFICSLITSKQFVYSTYSHIQEPAIFGIIFGVLDWLMARRLEKKNKNVDLDNEPKDEK